MNLESERNQFGRLDGKLPWWRSITDESMTKIWGKMKTLDSWRRIVLSASVVALAIDPLFFLIPVIDSDRYCFTFDKTVGVVVCVLRTFSDTFYAIHTIFNLKIDVKLPSSQFCSKTELKRKACRIIYLIVDILSILPIPQVMVFMLIDKNTAPLVTEKILTWIIICQFVPRFIRTYPIFREVTKSSGNVAESKWLGAAINFFLYMLFSYGFGAFWYVTAIEKQSICWREACMKKKDEGCRLEYLFCKSPDKNNTVSLNNTCPLQDPASITKNSTEFNFGMFTAALKSDILDVKKKEFAGKFIYCFRWGLRHLSSAGQNLETSNDPGENVFASVICVSGLLLFAVLIGNVQKYLQSSTTRVDERKENKRDTEEWMSKRNLPDHLKDGIRNHRDYKWRETRGMDEEILLLSLPKHLLKEIKRHLYKDLLDELKRRRQFQNMDERTLDDLCSRLKTAYYTKDSKILQEGEPVEHMFYIVSGNLETTTTGAAVFNAGFLCGEELFHWAFDSQSSNYPISRRTVTAITEVEGFLLSADDLKFIATECPLENRQDIMTP